MAEAKIRLALLWHMHQPYYKDPATGVYHLPWVRLHALKDYYGMVALLEEFPSVHQTFNLVPSLLAQLEEYAAGKAQERLQDIAFKPADALNLEERLFALRFLFQANVDHLISRRPRYKDLYERMQAHQFQAEQALSFFQPRDFTDLQVLSQLAWFDEFFLANDPDIRTLVEKQQGYTSEDQQLLRRKQQEALQKIIPAYRAAAQRGQIEVSTSPFYHPILPLLCDNYIAAEAHPGVRLPRRRFRHPEDARLQLARSVELHRRTFGETPQGLWPSEGSVSEEVLRLAASLGFRWIATDQRVLTNSTGVHFYRDATGTMVNAEKLYTAYRFATPSGPMHILFRDQELSDLIGFVYSRMEAEQAAADLVRRIVASAQPALGKGRSVLLPIILDGENAWEHFPLNGRPFLRALYRRLSEDPQIECLTVSEALQRHGETQPLARLAPGSWINGNFDIWLGSEEDNEAWDLLVETREFFTAHEVEAAPDARALALEELLVAEGSDWCWWYGPEHSTANDPDFDALYRTHLANIYRALGQRPPDSFSQPIARLRYDVVSTPPVSPVTPHIDGKVSSYFEWMGAGYYSPVTRASTMHGQPPLLRELHYGRDAENFSFRIDFFDEAPPLMDKDYFRVSIRRDDRTLGVLARLARSPEGKIDSTVRLEQEVSEAAPLQSQAALDRIFEFQVKLAALGLPSFEPFAFQVSLWRENLPLESLPLDGWLTVPVPS